MAASAPRQPPSRGHSRRAVRQCSAASADCASQREARRCSAAQAVSAVLRYLSRVGVVKYTCHSGYLSTAINENDLATVLTPAGGIFHALRVPGHEVAFKLIRRLHA